VLLLLAVLAANGHVLEARLEAAVGDGPDVAVRLAYRIEASSNGAAQTISYSALEIGGVAIDEVSAYASETPLQVDLKPRSGPNRAGSILLPQGTEAFELRYLVRRAAERTPAGLRVRLPCAILDLKIEETRTGLFSSSVALPAGLKIVDGYPAHSVAGEGGTFHWELPLVPAFVSFRASSGAALFTPPRIATIAVVVLLVAVAAVGVRRARSIRP
jgi:hypothetical protein